MGASYGAWDQTIGGQALGGHILTRIKWGWHTQVSSYVSLVN